MTFWSGSRHREPSYPAHAGYPVRRGFSIPSRASLEYWVARSSRAMTTGRVGAFVPNSGGALVVLEFVLLVDLVALLVPMRHRFPAPQRSGHVRLARSVGIALRRPRGNLLAR